MTNDNTLRLQFLVRVIGKESKYLQQTTSRLFSQPLDARLLATLERSNHPGRSS
ncbi:hypothetical protein [Arsukibacterium perlucidum]|uniref:hypothetical protein n=1 Tax=Arsukibacterium perlucidum TaxID=368811 RepID=UPI000369FCCD|nr:hypothetical protein [Arsukibacterium perlucidum]